MKRILALVLALTTAMSLTACVCIPDMKLPINKPTINKPVENTIPTTTPTFPEVILPTEPEEPTKSEAASEVEEMIDELGEITLDSLEQLSQIQSVVDSLTDEEYAEVENMDILEDAWDTYYTLSYQNAAAEIDAEINAAIESNDVDAIINAMFTYNDASTEVQAYVTQIDSLNDKADDIADRLLASMTKDEDFVRGMTFYYPDTFPMGTDYWYADERCFALPYMGVQNGSVWLRWVCNYTEDSWVFFENITFAVDDSRYYKTFGYFDVTRDNAGGDVWEYVDIQVDGTELEILAAIAESTTTVIRFEGDDYHYDFTVTAADKEAIRDMLTVYTLLGGN